MANYTDTTKITNFIGRALTQKETDALSGFILNAVDIWINRKLNTRFDSVASSTRYYDGGWHAIDTDPVQTVTQIKSINNDGSDSYLYTENVEFVLEPVNEDVKREVLYRGGRRFPRGQRRMAITGLFTEYDYTNSKVPDDIVLAATRLAGGVLNAGRITGQGGNIQQEALEGHEIRYDITANALESLMDSDPIIAGVIGARKEIYIYDDASTLDTEDGDDSW